MGLGRNAAVILCLTTFGVGCTDTLGPKSVKSRDPLLKVPGIKAAAESHDSTDEAQMVADLDSDDSAIRFYSIEGLRRLAGDDKGYKYYEDDDHRRAAVLKWKAWLAQRRPNAAETSTDSATNSEPKVNRNPGGWSTGG